MLQEMKKKIQDLASLWSNQETHVFIYLFDIEWA